MGKIEISLQEYGLSDVESKLYFALLKGGASTVIDLAKRTALNRATAHINLKSLIELGLASELHKGNKRVIIAEPPEKLSYLVEQEKWKLKRKEDNLKDVVGSIYDMVDNVKENTFSQVKYYEGKKAVSKLYDEILKSKEIRSYANTEEITKIFPENFDLFINYAKQKGELWDLLISNPHSEQYINLKDIPKYHLKYFPENMSFEPCDYLIYEDKIATIYGERKPYAIVIKNELLAKNALNIHKLLWNLLP
ncbi:MAG: helix-turn-helix domain-containing protein [Candidatus Dojkabacteria bacterium]